VSSYDEITDPIYQKMEAAREGDPETWSRINRGLRDAIVDEAVRGCPYYAEIISPDMTFRDIPILTKPLVRERLGDLLATGVPEERRVAKETAGSTGEPLRFFRDAAQGPMEYLSARRILKRLHGVDDEAVVVWVSTLPPSTLPDDPGPQRRRWLPGRRGGPFQLHPLPARELTVDRLRAETRRWRRFAPYVVYGYASTITWIASQVLDGAVDLPAPPGSVITTSDTLTEEGARSIEAAFGTPAHSWYGSHEFNGYVAGTLPGTRRYICNPLLVHVEVLDDQGRPVRPGETGRLVLTDLNNRVMPMVRYDTGDLATESAEGWRGGWRLLDGLVGRSSELLRLPGGVLLTHLLVGMALFRLADFHPYFSAYQCAQIGPAELELRVVWRAHPSDDVRRGAAEALGSVAGSATTVRVTDLEELDRLPSGKAWVLRREY
jgi:phenylacetate-CoA ligase